MTAVDGTALGGKMFDGTVFDGAGVGGTACNGNGAVVEDAAVDDAVFDEKLVDDAAFGRTMSEGAVSDGIVSNGAPVNRAALNNTVSSNTAFRVASSHGFGLDALLDDPSVPLDRILAEVDDVERRVRGLGDSLRPLHLARHQVARHLGDLAAAQREFDLWTEARRDLSSGCVACERGLIGDWYAQCGDDGRAFEAWDALFTGALFCGAEPHRALGRSLIPLVRAGRADQARANHVAGHRISRLKPPMSAAVGEHIEFCALTGNNARGLELLAEHGHWLADRSGTQRRAEFLGGVEVLLRILCESGFEDMPFAVVGGAADGALAGGALRPLGELREEVGEELSGLAARFDERNGTTAFSRRLMQRRSRQPFLSSLPLSAHTTLPRPAPREPAPVRAKARPVEELLAEARRLTLVWHPGALDAWRHVQVACAASDRQLAEDAQIELDEQLLLAERDATPHDGPEAVAGRYARLMQIADRYRIIGKPGPSLRAASRAALALFRGGRTDEAASEQFALRLAAADALAGREITPREYMAVRTGGGYQRFDAWVSAASAFSVQKPAIVAAAAREALDELVEVIEECRRFELSLHGAAAAAMAADVHLGCGEVEAAEERFRQAVELYLDGGAPWSTTTAELNLGRLERARGDFAAAERYARAAVEHNVDPALRGPAAMMLAEAIWFQGGRAGEAVAPALAAAAAFARQEGAAADEARAQLRAAEALAADGRHDEAAALFEPALRTLEARWDEDEWKWLIAQAVRAYGSSLMASGDPRRAAELLLDSAERVKDWPNQIPHATMAADAAAALQRSGRPRDAAAAFQRAADLWHVVGEPPARVRCLRSASWLLAGEDMDTALALMDRAGGELVGLLAATDGGGVPGGLGGNAQLRRLIRLELAETHLQRARMVLDLADEGRLPRDGSALLIGQAQQEITGAINGMRRLVEAGDAGGGAEADQLPARLKTAMSVMEGLRRYRVSADGSVVRVPPQRAAG